MIRFVFRLLKSILKVFLCIFSDRHISQIHFELLGETDGRFQIDKNSGEIFVIDHLDYETTREYNLKIRAFNNYDGTTDKKDDTAG